MTSAAVPDARADVVQRQVLRPHERAWRPLAFGVERCALGRDEAGVRETSILRFAAGACTAALARQGGEEFLVLAGSLHDEGDDYPDGTYVRNPPGAAGLVWAGPGGASVFVKSGEFAAADDARVTTDTRTARWHQGLVPGLAVLPLHQCGSEHVALVRWAPSTRFRAHHHWGGEEILVLEGVFEDEHGAYPTGTWLRSPHMSQHDPFTGADGALIYVKTGHLGPTNP